MRPIGYLKSMTNTDLKTNMLILYEYDSLYNKRQYFAKALNGDVKDLVFDIGNYQ